MVASVGAVSMADSGNTVKYLSRSGSSKLVDSEPDREKLSQLVGEEMTSSVSVLTSSVAVDDDEDGDKTAVFERAESILEAWILNMFFKVVTKSIDDLPGFKDLEMFSKTKEKLAQCEANMSET